MFQGVFGTSCSLVGGTGHEMPVHAWWGIGYHEEHASRAYAEMISWFEKHLGAS